MKVTIQAKKDEIASKLPKKAKKLADFIEKKLVFDVNRVFYKTKTLDFVFHVRIAGGTIELDVERHKIAGLNLGFARKIARKILWKHLRALNALDLPLWAVEHKGDIRLKTKGIGMLFTFVAINKGEITLDLIGPY